MVTTHPRRTLLVVLAFVLVAGVVGGPLAGRLSTSGGFVAPGADSQVAQQRLATAGGRESSPAVVLLTAPRAREAAAARLARIPGVVSVATPAAGIVTATLRTGTDDEEVAQEALDAFAGREDVTVGGPAVADLQIGETVGADLGRAEMFALPILVLLSLLFFRGRAALLPLAVGVTTVLGTFLALSAINELYALNVYALNLVVGLGLGLAIDYTLFLVTRFREELAHDGAPAAVRTTMRIAGRTVAFSAATVAFALATLTVFPQAFLKSMGIAGATVAVVAAAAALVIAPALFALWGAKLARPKQDVDGSHGRWHALAHLVMRRPGLVAAATATAMLAFAFPALGTTWSPVDASAIPKGLSSRTVADALARSDGRAQAPVVVAVAAPAHARTDVEAFAARIAGLAGVERVAPPRFLGRSTWQVSATAAGDPAGPVAQGVVERIRRLPTRAEAWVGGDAAEFVDQQAAIGSRLLLAVALLCGLTMVILWLMTGSLVLPVKAVLMNALTVGAALAPLTLIYQHGRLTGLLGYTPNGGVEPTDFLVTAAIVFALSTDYGVFLLGRIKEARDAGLPEREAVATGLARTGRVVTAAAILLAVAIGAFSTSSISFIQQIGVATAAGVLIDAFVVRALLVPSLMALLGKWNWWSPRLLRRVHAGRSVRWAAGLG